MENAVTVIPMPKRTAPGAVRIFETQEPLHTYQDPLFGEFRIYKSVGAGRKGFWEEDTSKLQKVIDGRKLGMNLKAALTYAGIDDSNWYRFLSVYPRFREVVRACGIRIVVKALNSVENHIDNKPELAYRIAKDQGAVDVQEKKVDDEKPPVQPTVAVAVQVNNKFDEEKLEAKARTISGGILAEGSGQSEGESSVRVASTVQS